MIAMYLLMLRIHALKQVACACTQDWWNGCTLFLVKGSKIMSKCFAKAQGKCQIAEHKYESEHTHFNKTFKRSHKLVSHSSSDVHMLRFRGRYWGLFLPLFLIASASDRKPLSQWCIWLLHNDQALTIGMSVQIQFEKKTVIFVFQAKSAGQTCCRSKLSDEENSEQTFSIFLESQKPRLLLDFC
jgi:hypothetical protein